MEAIEAVIAEPYNDKEPEMGGYDGAILSKLVTIEDKVKMCRAFIRFLADVEPELLFKLAGESGGGESKKIEPKPDHITDNNQTYYASDDGYDGYSEVTVNVPEPTETLQVSIESSESPKTVDVKDAAFVEITVVG